MLYDDDLSGRSVSRGRRRMEQKGISLTVSWVKRAVMLGEEEEGKMVRDE